MKLSDFDYNLPKELIAQEPAEPRDSSRLLVLNKESGKIQHAIFNQLGDYLKAGDVLVFNNSKVIPARLAGKKKTGGKIEVFLLRKIDKGSWEALLDSKVKINDIIKFADDFRCKVTSLPSDSTKWIVEFDKTNKDFDVLLDIYGQTPLPPYIKSDKQKDGRYQTIYADDEKKGSVAAPTAGLHFTDELLKILKEQGIRQEFVTLHVGLGTFEPVRTENIKNHKMHAEFAEIDSKTLTRLQKAKKEGRRIISVGTTTARTLEFFSSLITDNYSTVNYARDWINIFIYPGYEFKCIDGLITNFHLPKSTLLILVSAFAGSENIKEAYQEAINKKYRFYSFGDAMFIK